MQIHRYYLPSENGAGSGWAEILLTAGGMFAAVSDFGNYAYAWRHHGRDDVRKFFVREDAGNWDYFAHKLGGEHAEEYDPERTLKNVKRVILERRRRQTYSKDEAAKEWALLVFHNDLEHAFDFSDWLRETRIEDAAAERRERVGPMLERFCKETLQRLSRAIEAELALEAASKAGAA